MPAGVSQTTPAALEQQPVRTQPSPIATDIHFIEEDVPATQEKSRQLPLATMLLLFLLVPLLFFVKKIALMLAPLYKHLPLIGTKKNLLAMYQAKLVELIEYNEFEKLYNLFIDFFAHLTHTKTSTEDSMIYELEKRGIWANWPGAFVSGKTTTTSLFGR